MVTTKVLIKIEQQLDDLHRQVDYERERLVTLVNSLIDGVVATDSKGKILVYNGAVLNILDTNVSLNGKQFRQAFKLIDEQKFKVDIVAETKKAGTSISRDDLTLILKSGEAVNLELTISPVYRSNAHSHSGYMILLKDITKEKSLEEQREEFISVASHELRTPIAVAEANISTALFSKEANLNQAARKLLEQAHSQVVFLAELINDLTKLARVERSDLELEQEEVDPFDLIQRLLNENLKSAQQKGLELSLLTPKVKPKMIQSSAHLIEEVLQNFVTNAIKYTEKGFVKMVVEQDITRDGVVFSVEDSGIGVSKSDQKHLFSKFYRAQDYRTAKIVGTGLGLYLSQKNAQKLGGEIWFKSTINKGSTFYLWVPENLAVVTPKEVDKNS